MIDDQQRVSNEQIDRKLESFVEAMLQKLIDLHTEIKTLKKKVHDLEKKQQSVVEVDERIGVFSRLS